MAPSARRIAKAIGHEAASRIEVMKDYIYRVAKPAVRHGTSARDSPPIRFAHFGECELTQDRETWDAALAEGVELHYVESENVA